MSVSPEVAQSNNSVLLMITGPSGVGKDTVVKTFRERHPLFHFLITSTSRRIRCNPEGQPIEVHGRDYLFESRQEFEKGIEEGDFVEHAIVYGEYKGLRKSQIARVTTGEDLILRVDPVATANYENIILQTDPNLAQNIIPRIVKIYVGAPSLWTMGYRRIQREGRTNWPIFVQRVQDDWKIWNKIKDRFNGDVILNYDGRLDDTVAQIEDIVSRKKQQLVAA